MAANRVAKTSIEWAKLLAALPKEQQHIQSSLLAKNYQYLSK
jgi:hypothetical protein